MAMYTVTANVVVNDITWESIGIPPLTVYDTEPLELFCFVHNIMMLVPCRYQVNFSHYPCLRCWAESLGSGCCALVTTHILAI